MTIENWYFKNITWSDADYDIEEDDKIEYESFKVDVISKKDDASDPEELVLAE